HVDMQERNMAAIMGSTEEGGIINVQPPEAAIAAEEERRAKVLDDALPEARRGFPAELVFAGDQFIITPAGRAEEAARAHAAGDEVRTVIAGHHLRGTRFNIHVDPRDGLLTQGTEGYQLTWMDAKMGDWVVTPRRGKAVEINALWYNALELLARWCREEGNVQHAEKYSDAAKRTHASFNQRFWFAGGGYLFDVVDCNGQSGTTDSSCRPNQIFAISLEHTALEQSRWSSVVEVVEEKLVT